MIFQNYPFPGKVPFLLDILIATLNRQERGSKRQEKQKSTESGNRASREVPEILIESSPGTPASDNSDIVIVDNTNTDLAGLTITDSTEDEEEIEEIRMDSMADDQQSNLRLDRFYSRQALDALRIISLLKHIVAY